MCPQMSLGSDCCEAVFSNCRLFSQRSIPQLDEGEPIERIYLKFSLASSTIAAIKGSVVPQTWCFCYP